MYLSLLSDWDLDVAFVSAAKPYLQLKMDVKPAEDSKDAIVLYHLNTLVVQGMKVETLEEGEKEEVDSK